jgi:hypothetical protein
MRQFALTLLCLVACSKQEAPAPKAEPTIIEPRPTAMGTIQKVHDSFTQDCGRDIPTFQGLEDLEPPGEEADELLAQIGQMAQECADLHGLSEITSEAETTCQPDCHWCPIKWYWCIENAGACAGGDNKSCCKLGACGGKHHCELVCKSSCGCDVPPLPSDGGGGGEEE